MELAAVPASGSESLLQSTSFPNRLRKTYRNCLVQSLVWGSVGFVALGLSALLTPECPNQTPRMTTSNWPCQYQWKLENFTCDRYCCHVPKMMGDVCTVCFSDACITAACSPATSQLNYVLGSMLQFSGPVLQWIVFMLIFLFARAACKSNPSERPALMKAAGAFVVIVLFMFFLLGIYFYTDCHQKFRGLADVLLAISLLGLLNFFTCLVQGVLVKASVPKLDALLSLMAEAGNRRDTDSLLLLEVGEDRLRSFWEGQLQEDLTYSLNVRYGCPWLAYCGFAMILLCPVLFIYLWTARATLFLLVFWFQLGGRVAGFHIMKQPAVQRWWQRRKIKAQLAHVPPKLTVVLFHNNRSEGLGEPADRQDFSLMSAAFFSESEIFIQHAPSDGGGLTPSLFTRSSLVESNHSWRLCFVTSARHTHQTLFAATSTEVELPQFFPLEAEHVQIAREWLARHEVFHFEE